MKKRRPSNSATHAAGFDKLDRPVKAWLLDDYDMLEHGDAIMFMADGFEADFQKWWKLHKPGEPFRDPYKWWCQREAEAAQG